MASSSGPSDKSRVLCRYYMHGCCRYKNGECPFAHDLSIAPTQVCKYYLAGCCVYGAGCRYDHVRPEWTRGDNKSGSTPAASGVQPTFKAEFGASSSSANSTSASGSGGSSAQPVAWQAPAETLQRLQLEHHDSSVADDWEDTDAIVRRLPQSLVGGDGGEPAASPVHDQGWEGAGEGGGTLHPGEPDRQDDGQYEQGAEQDGQYIEDEYDEQDSGQYNNQAWYEAEAEGAEEAEARHWWSSEGADVVQEPDTEDVFKADVEPSQRPLCGALSAYGTCPHGGSCKHVHGHVCEVCHKHVIHPYNAEEAEQHRRDCAARHARLAARIRSADVECGICLEKVLSAPNPADRRFGILTGCDHAFCLKCIRAWRTTGAGDLETAVRACPVCRATSHYITPSLVWPADAADKERILDGYKEKLATIDCTHFQRGEGRCPFGTSCFYRHMYKDGTLQSREPSLRLARDDEGEVHVLQTHRLSDFLAAAGLEVRPPRRRRPAF